MAASRTFVTLGANFSTTTATPGVVVTGFAFTPLPNLRYNVEGIFLMRSAVLAVGARPGVTFPTGIVDGVQLSWGTGNGNGPTIYHVEGDVAAAGHTCLFTSQDNLSYSYPVLLRARFETGATPIGDFQVILESETGGTSVTLRQHSFLAYYSGYTNQ